MDTSGYDGWLYEPDDDVPDDLAAQIRAVTEALHEINESVKRTTEAMRRFTDRLVYAHAGWPFGTTEAGFDLWLRYGCRERAN